MGINVNSRDMSLAQQEGLMTRARKVDLLQFMTSLGIKYRSHSTSVSCLYCPSCLESTVNSTKVSITGHLWNCWACGKGGTVIDYAAYYWEISTIEASKKLVDMSGNSFFGGVVESASAYVKSAASAFVNTRPKEVRDYSAFLKKLHYEGHTFNKEAFEYLTKVRGISEKVITEAVQRGLIRFLPSNPHEATKWLLTKFQKAQLIKLGLWREEAKYPWIVMRPMICFLPGFTSAEFRMIKAPKEGDIKSIRIGHSEKPYFWKGKTSESLAVCEGVLDLLSLIDMNWKHDIKALPGTQTFNEEILDDYKTVFTLTDNDKAGIEVAAQIDKVAKERGQKSIVKHPALGDINKELIAKKKLAAKA